MKIYVASSWRNDYQPTVVKALEENGHEVYDFKHPDWSNCGQPGSGFHWSEVDDGWQSWSFEQYLGGLSHELAETGFKSDMDAMEWADACVLVLPCGRSAHLELGWFVGLGKATCILHSKTMMEPELMSKMVDAQFNNLVGVVAWCNTIGRNKGE